MFINYSLKMEYFTVMKQEMDISIKEEQAQFEDLSSFEERIIKLQYETGDDDIDSDSSSARLNYHLIELNSASLRNNPHNVFDWLKRVELFEGQPRNIINIFSEAVQTVDPEKAVGELHSLWVAFAKYYEEKDMFLAARNVFEAAILVPYLNLNDLACVYCEYAEMFIRFDCFREPLKLMQCITTMLWREKTREKYHGEFFKIWSLRAHLEENCGTFETCKAAYEEFMHLKIATPEIIIKYVLFLEKNNCIKEAFTVYETGIESFVSPKNDDSCLRQIFKKAVEISSEENIPEICLRYADMEEKLKDFDRARSIYINCSEISDLRISYKFWRAWKKFEITHGTEDSRIKMLRTMRYKQAVYKRQINLANKTLKTVEKNESIYEMSSDELIDVEELETDNDEFNIDVLDCYYDCLN